MAPRKKDKNTVGKRSLRGFKENKEDGKKRKEKKDKGMRTGEVLRERLRKQEVEKEKVKLESERVLA